MTEVTDAPGATTHSSTHGSRRRARRPRRLWSSALAVASKEAIHIRRDRSTLVLAIALPLFQLVLFGFIDMTVEDLATIVVDQSRTTESRLLVEQLGASKTFDVVGVTDDPRVARERIVAGAARVGVVIPPDFAGRRLRGETTTVLAWIDGSDANVSAQALGSINGLMADKSLDVAMSARTPYEVRPLILFNPAGRTANYIIPGLVAILLQIVALVLSAMAIVKERERGTLEQLLVTPIDPVGLVLGKLAPYLLFGLAEAGLILVVMRFGFAVPIRGSLVFLGTMAIVYLFALLALGVFVSTLAETQLAAQQLAQLLLLPSIFLSGYIFPAEGLPFVLRWAGQLMPATHMIAILRGVVLRDAGPGQLWGHIVILLAMSGLLVFASARRFSKVAR